MNLFYKKYKFSGFLLLINIFSAPFLFAGELEKESFLLDKKTIFAEAFNNTPTIENINSSFLSSKLTKNQYLENFQTNFEGDISYFKTQEDAFVDFIPIAPKERNFSIALKKDFISGIAFEASNNIRNTRYQNYGNDVENYISLDLTIDLYQDFFGRNSKARIAYLGYEEEIAKIKKEIDTEIFLNSLYRIYISLIFNEEQIRISNNILDIYIKQENDARRRYNNGITDLSEVKRRSSQVESKKVDILALKNSKQNLILNLKELLPSLALKNIELASYNTNSLETYFINIINKIDSKKDTPMDYTSYDEMVRLIENSYKKQKKFTNNYADIDLELYSNYKHIGQNNNDRDALNNLYLQSDHSYEVGLRLTAPIGKTKINSEKIQLSLQQSNFLAKKRKNLSKIHAYHSQSLKNLQLLRSAQQYQSKNSNDLKKILSLSAEYAHDWRKKMSDHVAYALLVYTGLQIFATMGAMKETGMKMMALFALVVLVGAIIPACRKFERRWRNLTDEQASDMAYESAFKRDLIGLWLLAIGLPFVLTMLFKGIAAIM